MLFRSFSNIGQCYHNAHKLGGDTNRFFAVGSSLGGGVAVGVALKLIDENLGYMISGIVVLCPALIHPDFVPEEYKPFFNAYKETWSDAPIQNGESMMVFYGELNRTYNSLFQLLMRGSYSGHNNGTNQRMNPYAFPCLHTGISRLPPVYQAICEADPVRDDSTVFRYQLDKAG